MRRALMLTLCASTAGLAGCGLLAAGKDVADATVRMAKPRGHDYREETPEIDEWNLRNEARGDRPLDRESDGLTPFVSSAKARSIERSLGVE